MSPQQQVILATVAAGAVLVTLVLVPPVVGLWYLAVGLVYVLAKGLRNRLLLRRTTENYVTSFEDAEHPGARPGDGWRFVPTMLFVAVLISVLVWPVGIARGLYDWWSSAPTTTAKITSDGLGASVGR